MASLDSYLRERDEKIEKGTLAYGYSSSTTRVDFNRLNANTYKHNNGAYHDRTKFYY